MGLVVISAILAVFFITSALLYNVGVRMDLKSARLGSIRGADEAEGEEEDNKNFFRKLKDDAEKRKAARLRGRQLADSKQKAKPTLVGQMLQMAGIPLSAGQFTLLKAGIGMMLAMACLVTGKIFALDPKLMLLIPVAGFIFGMILPGRWLTGKVEKKKAMYRDALPDIMDLLVVSVEAGLGFDSALIRLYEKDKSPLMEELMRTVQDVQHGMSKREAYGNMISRCGVKEIISFLNALLQAEQLGISIKSVLKTQAETLREDRRQRAEEKALKAPVKMLIPLVIFIFPVIFIILLGPAVMNIMDIFGNG